MTTPRWLFIYRVLVISVSLGFIAGSITAGGPVR